MQKKQRDGRLGLLELIAIGVGGMIGGGIFSVLGIAVGISGHAAPLAFGLGGLIAMLAGYSYARLAVTFQSDGASFTYLEHAFPKHPNIGGLMGWTVIVGYIGTLALYAYTFGAYAAALLGYAESGPVRMGLSTGVLLVFMLINLLGTRTSGVSEDIIVLVKVCLLLVFGVAGMSSVRADHVLPVFDQGVVSVFVAGAIVFVAFEGFQLITNTVNETRDPIRNTPRGIYISIAAATSIYLLVSFVSIGNLTAAEFEAASEYALAVAAEPVLGRAGEVLVGIAAMLSTSSAINATSFGASRMMSEMATEHLMPSAFSFRSRETNVPWVAVVALTALGIAFTILNSLESIAAFSSVTFLLVSIGVGVANLRLRHRTKANPVIVVFGIVVMATTIMVAGWYMWSNEQETLITLAALYAAVFVAEFVFSKRALFRQTPRTDSKARRS